MEAEYGDITCEEALGFALADPVKAREDTLTLLQVPLYLPVPAWVLTITKYDA